MRLATIASFVVLLLLPVAVRGEMYVIQNEAYRTCHSSTECVSFNMPCAAPISINRSYQAVFEQTKIAQLGRFSCHVAKYNPANYPVCLGGFCSFGPRNSVDTLNESDPRYCTSVGDCQVAVDRCGRKFPVNSLNLATKQAELDAAEDRGCDRTETRPVKEMRCISQRCNVILDNYPNQ